MILTLDEKMIRFRAKYKLSQAKLAEMCGYTVQTICNVENGTQKPSKRTAARILMAMEEYDESKHKQD